MLTTDTISLSFGPGTHGSTFGGNPLACAVAAKAFDLIHSAGTMDNVHRQSEKLQAQLRALGEESGVFKSVRGVGLLIGCVLADEYAGRASELMQQALEQGVMVLVAGSDVLRLAPSLLLTDEDAEQGIHHHVTLRPLFREKPDGPARSHVFRAGALRQWRGRHMLGQVQHLHLQAGLARQMRQHVAVTAIVTRPADHAETARTGPGLRQMSPGSPACALHQHVAIAAKQFGSTHIQRACAACVVQGKETMHGVDSILHPCRP